MKITINAVKHFPTMSEETECFQANLLVDGKKIGVVSNRGHGGCDEFQGDHAAYRAANDWCKANLPPWDGYDGPVPTDLEVHVGNLLNTFLIRKSLQKDLRSKILTKDGPDIYAHSFKGVRKLTPEHLRAFEKRNPGTVILNNMDLDKAVEIYQQGASA